MAAPDKLRLNVPAHNPIIPANSPKNGPIIKIRLNILRLIVASTALTILPKLLSFSALLVIISTMCALARITGFPKTAQNGTTQASSHLSSGSR